VSDQKPRGGPHLQYLPNSTGWISTTTTATATTKKRRIRNNNNKKIKSWGAAGFEVEFFVGFRLTLIFA